jgi:hypothetical protein
MSCQIIEDKTYQKVSVTLRLYRSEIGPISELKREEIEKAVEELRRENFKSYMHRYSEIVPITPIDFRMAYPMTKIQLLKSLHCIRYNSTAHKELGKLWNDIISALEYEIITNLEQYQAASWG